MLNEGLSGCVLYMNRSALMSKDFSLMSSEFLLASGSVPWALDTSLGSRVGLLWELEVRAVTATQL